MTAVRKTRLRPMRPEDLDAVIEVELACYPHPWTRGIFEDCLRVGYCCWVLESAGQVVGYGVMSVAAGESHILNLCVRNDMRRRGWGRMMLEHLLVLARDHGADTALLEVRPSNREAIRLYEGMAFHEVGLRRNYYPDRAGREDALIMARHLT